jgi:hypothetical protein
MGSWGRGATHYDVRGSGERGNDQQRGETGHGVDINLGVAGRRLEAVARIAEPWMERARVIL